MEEKEAIAIQQRMAAALRETDFQGPQIAEIEVKFNIYIIYMYL